MRLPAPRSIDRKVLRDLLRMGTQVVAVALVMACGVGFYITMRAAMRSLETAKTQYYARQRFADVFAGLTRAPEAVADELRAIPGVTRVETRVVSDVTLDVPGLLEAAVGRLVSLPETGRPSVNDIVLRQGRLPEPGREGEVVASEAFMEAHELAPGATVGAVVNGRWKTLKIVGTALSPEYVFSVGPSSLFPDDRLFGVFWMRREALASAFDMEGAFNDVALLLGRGASAEGVIERVDTILDRYGGGRSVARKDQTSAFYLENELRQLESFAFMVPVLFLLVAAFLLYIVLGRVVAAQRGQIAVLKALGYRDREVGAHFAKLVGGVALAGVVLGILLGAGLGTWMTRMYGDYYRFPALPFRMGVPEVVEGMAFSLAAAGLGTWTAILRTIRLAPAEAMRPAAPPTFRPTLLERVGLSRFVSPSSRMVLREIERKPLRAGLTVTGIALATALTVFNAFTLDALLHMLNVQFGLIQREDVEVSLYQPRTLGTLRELEHLPGVSHAEPYRAAAARLRAGPASRVVSVMGIPAGASLYALLDRDLEEIDLPREGLVLSRALADILGVRAGDLVEVELLEKEDVVRWVPVVMLAETYVGLTAHMELAALADLLDEPPTLNGARLLVDEDRIADLHAAVKRTPVIAGASSRDRALRIVQELLDQSLGTWVFFSVSFSMIMALGVLYNAARINLAERARELASLRVLGFRRREVGAILLGEMALLTVLAIPPGLWMGRGLARVLVESPGFQSEQFRLPFVIAPSTYALAVLVTLAAATLSAFAAWRKLDRTDIIEVLKTRE